MTTKLVPLEPTEEMIAAGLKADRDYSNNCFHGLGHLDRCSFIYHFMLSAAPSAEPVAWVVMRTDTNTPFGEPTLTLKEAEATAQFASMPVVVMPLTAHGGTKAEGQAFMDEVNAEMRRRGWDEANKHTMESTRITGEDLQTFVGSSAAPAGNAPQTPEPNWWMSPEGDIPEHRREIVAVVRKSQYDALQRRLLAVTEARDWRDRELREAKVALDACVERAEQAEARVRELEGDLAYFTASIAEAQDKLASWIIPDSRICDDTVLNQLLGILDDPVLVRRMRARAKESK